MSKTKCPGAAISWLLLTPGAENAPQRFARQLTEYAWYAHELAGTPLMIELLGRMTADSNPQVRDEAAQLLASFQSELQHGRQPFQ